jgi:UDP-N-acetylmuramoyl-L-alanyl-D-glutamate--2,6-diaminopimelate ligase
MEVSSHSLVQHRVHYINFVAASFTNLTLDHLDYHKTMQNYAKAKKMLFDNLQPDAIAVINNDDPFADYIIMDCKAKHIFRVGRQSDADYSIKNEKLSLKGVEFDIVKNNITYKIQSPLLGKFNIDNLAQAFVIASELGFEPKEICKSLESATGALGRMEKYDLPNGALAIIDYAHTPDALEKALQSLKQIHCANSVDGKIICVFGCGGNRDKSKRPKMGKIACDFSDFVIITNDNPRNEDPQAIFNDILEGINIEMQNKVSIIPDRAEAIHSAIELSKENDIIFIAGKGHEEYQIIAGERRAFSDRQIVLDYSK